MIVVGASRHAKEILQILSANNISVDFLFDDVSTIFHPYFDQFTIIRGLNDSRLKSNKEFILGLGGTLVRKKLYEEFTRMHLSPKSVFSNTAVIGVNSVLLGKALNVMHFVFISDNVTIGDGALINAYASIHHDVEIGSFTEISPKAILLGGVRVGSLTSIGAGAVILPDIQVGNWSRFCCDKRCSR